MIKVEEWAEIRRLYQAERLPIKEIVRRLGLSRNTVRAAIRASAPPTYQRPRRQSVFDEYEPRVRALLQEHPRMPASVIAERVGWSRSDSMFRARIAELRPIYKPPEPYQRTEYEPGELAQWDIWFPPVQIPIGPNKTAILPVLVGTAGYSRMTVGHMIPSRESHDYLAGHWECVKKLGVVPRLGVYDGEGAVGRWRTGKTELTKAFQEFRGVLGMNALILKPAFPEGKGMVERDNGYFETSFLPGRTFESIDDFNQQFTEWLNTRANLRFHRTLRCRPLDRWDRDREAMMALPPVAPDTILRTATRRRPRIDGRSALRSWVPPIWVAMYVEATDAHQE